MDSILEAFLEDSRDQDFQLCQLGTYCSSALIASLIYSVSLELGACLLHSPQILCKLSSLSLGQWEAVAGGREEVEGRNGSSSLHV